jgi:hypothetical protein
LKAGAEQAVKTAKDAAVKTWIGTGPVQHAQLAGAAGPDAYWSTFNASPGATYGPNVAAASYQAAKAFMPAPTMAPIPGLTATAPTPTATSTLPKVATAAPNPITSKPPSPTAKTENPYKNYDPQVAQLQRDLNAQGYNAGPVDGQMGPQTKAAADARKADQAKSGSSAADRSSSSTGSSSGSGGSSSSSGHQTPSGQSYPDKDAYGHEYGTSSYGTGVSGV